jgi:hypothetical protein
VYRNYTPARVHKIVTLPLISLLPSHSHKDKNYQYYYS